MTGQFDFDEKKTPAENIEAFLSYIETSTGDVGAAFGRLLRSNLDKLFPLPDATKRSLARSSFNGEIKKQLDAALAARKAKP